MRHRLEETKDIVLTLVALLQRVKAKHVFLVRGHRSFEECGAGAAFVDVIKQWPLDQLTEFADFSTNPKEEEAHRGVELLMEKRPDVIIAIGGGSVMDMAKLIRHYAVEQRYPLPLWAIPTTAGTGAEATHFAVMYKDGVKHSIEAEDIWPDIAILYAPFTYKNNAYLTACTGFDALAQAIEAFWNPNATDESDKFALRGIEHILHTLPKCIENPDETYRRDNLLYGAYCAGRAINITKTTAPHAFSYAFTTHCGYPHGHAVAITFPFFAKLNMANNPKDGDLRWMLGLDKDADLQKYFVRYVDRIGLRYNGTNGQELHELLSHVNLERLKNNPVKITEKEIEELRQMIERLYYMDRLKVEIPAERQAIFAQLREKYNPDGSKVRKYQLHLNETLKEFDAFCREHGIVYYLGYGSLLGAVRHKGFIPWDDDADLWMDRENYAKLEKLMKGEYHQLSENVYVTMGIRPELWSPPYAYVDIFILDDCPNGRLAAWWKEMMAKLMYVMVKCRGRIDARKFGKFKSYFVLAPLSIFRSTEGWKSAYKRVSMWFNGKGSQMQVYNGIFTEIKRKYPKGADVWEPIEAEFEGNWLLIPKGWDRLLTMLYKDYMQLPKADELHVHGFVDNVEVK